MFSLSVIQVFLAFIAGPVVCGGDSLRPDALPGPRLKARPQLLPTVSALFVPAYNSILISSFFLPLPAFLPCLHHDLEMMLIVMSCVDLWQRF